MRLKSPVWSRHGWEGSGVRFLLYPMGIFFFSLFKVKAMAKGARVDTIPTKFPSLRCPHRRPSDKLVGSLWRELFRTKRPPS